MAMKPKKQIQTRQVGPLTLRAAVEPETLDPEKRTVDLTWTTGARVLRQPFFGEAYYEELSLNPRHVRLDRLRNGAPLLDSHNGYDLGGQIGVVEKARIENGVGIATVRFPSEGIDAAADAIFRKVADGIVRNVSVGYRVHRLEKQKSGEEETPVMRATDWEPYEISLVPMGADPAASIRADGAGLNLCEVISQEERHMKEEQSQGVATAETEKKIEQRAQVDEAAVRKQAVEAERKRIAQIRTAAGHAKLEGEFVERLISDGISAEEAAVRILEELGKAAPKVDVGTGPIVAGADERDKFRAGAEHWLYERSGVAGLIAEHAKKKGETFKLDSGEFRGMTMARLAEESNKRQGVKPRSNDPRDVIGEALAHRGGVYQGNSDFTTLLENALNKTLLAAYATAPDTWRNFCKVGSVSDFRAHNRYRQGTFGVLDKVLEGAEFTNKQIPDGSKETITASTYGNIIAITRQALINDDMGAFMDLAQRLGRAAGLSVEVAVYDLLKLQTGTGPNMSDGHALFDDTYHSNVSTGAAISAAAIDADRIKLASQTDPSGNEILDLRPYALVIPIGLGGTARTINDAQYDPDTANKLQKPNNVRGLFRTIVDTPRLTGTRRYIFADPAVAPTIEVAFLNGQEAPFMESQQGWRTDGSEWKVRLDYAVAAVDWRGAVMNAGT